ncbi:MAG: hypothetical protein KA275_01360 [Chitinophagaceae bacterium]|nr:hypothetical protein [Chitinophagaceae bacterium]
MGRKDNFFYLGGHSLLAIQLIAIIKRDLNFNPTLKSIFKYH